MVTARAGSSRFTATALMVAALAACSVLSVYGEPTTSQRDWIAAGSSIRVISERTPTATSADHHADHDEDGEHASEGAGHGLVAYAFACRSALRPAQEAPAAPPRGTTSSAPVTLLRRNSRPSRAGQLAGLDHAGRPAASPWTRP